MPPSAVRFICVQKANGVEYGEIELVVVIGILKDGIKDVQMSDTEEKESTCELVASDSMGFFNRKHSLTARDSQDNTWWLEEGSGTPTHLASLQHGSQQEQNLSKDLTFFESAKQREYSSNLQAQSPRLRTGMPEHYQSQTGQDQGQAHQHQKSQTCESYGIDEYNELAQADYQMASQRDYFEEKVCAQELILDGQAQLAVDGSEGRCEQYQNQTEQPRFADPPQFRDHEIPGTYSSDYQPSAQHPSNQEYIERDSPCLLDQSALTPEEPLEPIAQGQRDCVILPSGSENCHSHHSLPQALVSDTSPRSAKPPPPDIPALNPRRSIHHPGPLDSSPPLTALSRSPSPPPPPIPPSHFTNPPSNRDGHTCVNQVSQTQNRRHHHQKDNCQFAEEWPYHPCLENEEQGVNDVLVEQVENEVQEEVCRRRDENDELEHGRREDQDDWRSNERGTSTVTGKRKREVTDVVMDSEGEEGELSD